MVRNYTRKSNRQSWLEDDMKVAVLAVVERTMTYDASYKKKSFCFILTLHIVYYIYVLGRHDVKFCYYFY